MKGDRVPSLENPQRGEGVEPRAGLCMGRSRLPHQWSSASLQGNGQGHESLTSSLNRQPARIAKPRSDEGECLSVSPEGRTRVMASESEAKLGELILAPAEIDACRVCDLLLKHQKPLSDRRYGATRAVKRSQQPLETKTKSSNQIVERLAQPALEGAQVANQGSAFRDDDLGGVGRSCCPHVCHEIGNRYIDFVTDSAHHRNAACSNCPGHALVIERPKVLCRATAPRYDHDIELLEPLHHFESGDDRSWGIFTLNAAICDHQANGTALRGDPNDIPKRRPGATGDHADHPRQLRQRALALGIE